MDRKIMYIRTFIKKYIIYIDKGGKKEKLYTINQQYNCLNKYDVDVESYLSSRHINWRKYNSILHNAVISPLFKTMFWNDHGYIEYSEYLLITSCYHISH